MAMEMRKYKELKAAGRVTIEPYGAKVIIKLQMFDAFSGAPVQDVEIIELESVKKQRDQFDVQFTRMQLEKENFDQFVLDVEAASPK